MIISRNDSLKKWLEVLFTTEVAILATFACATGLLVQITRLPNLYNIIQNVTVTFANGLLRTSSLKNPGGLGNFEFKPYLKCWTREKSVALFGINKIIVPCWNRISSESSNLPSNIKYSKAGNFIFPAMLVADQRGHADRCLLFYSSLLLIFWEENRFVQSSRTFRGPGGVWYLNFHPVFQRMDTGFVLVLENLKSPEIFLWYFPGLESPGKRPLVLESLDICLTRLKNMAVRRVNIEILGW